MTTRLATPAATTVPAASSAVFESSQRRRLTPCVQANRYVPNSSSRAISGAPTKRPASAGSTAMTRVAVTSPPNSLSKWGDDDVAAGARRGRKAGRQRIVAKRRRDRQMRSTAATASARSRPRAPSACDQCCRHVTHAIAAGPFPSPQVGQALGRHVGEQKLLEADGIDGPGGIDDRPVGDGEHRQLAPAVALANHLAHAADRAERPPRAGQEPVRLEQLVDVPLEADAAAGQQHDVVADALDVGDDVRRDDDGRTELGDPVHQQLQQLAGGERIEARERLVEQDEPRPLAQREREREPGALAGRERPHLRARVDARQELDGDLAVPARVRAARDTRSCPPPGRSGRAARPARRSRPLRGPPVFAAGRRRARRSSPRSARARPPRGRGASTFPPRSALPARRPRPSESSASDRAAPSHGESAYPGRAATRGGELMPRDGPETPAAWWR